MVSFFLGFFFAGRGYFLAVLTVAEPTEANPNLNNAFVISNKMILACISIIKSKHLTDSLGIAKKTHLHMCYRTSLWAFFLKKNVEIKRHCLCSTDNIGSLHAWPNNTCQDINLPFFLNYQKTEGYQQRPDWGRALLTAYSLKIFLYGFVYVKKCGWSYYITCLSSPNISPVSPFAVQKVFIRSPSQNAHSQLCLVSPVWRAHLDLRWGSSYM